MIGVNFFMLVIGFTLFLFSLYQLSLIMRNLTTNEAAKLSSAKRLFRYQTKMRQDEEFLAENPQIRFVECAPALYLHPFGRPSDAPLTELDVRLSNSLLWLGDEPSTADKVEKEVWIRLIPKPSNPFNRGIIKNIRECFNC